MTDHIIPTTDEQGAVERDSDSAGAEVVEVELVAPDAGALGVDLPDDPSEARDVLVDALAKSRAETGQILEQLQRIAAEYENFRRRAERDRQQLTTLATQRIVEQLLPTMDNFEAALTYAPRGEAEQKLMQGMIGTYAQLRETLASHGCAEIPTNGVAFDPAVHEAVSAPPEGDGALVVGQELRKGYLVDGKVVRPAMVTVVYQPAAEDDDGDDDA